MPLAEVRDTNGASLENLRAESRKRYADYPVEIDADTTVVLRAPLRLSTEERQRVRELQRDMKELQDDSDNAEAEVVEVLREMIRLVSDDTTKADRLIAAVGDDLALLQTIFADYSERAQPGEASNSVG